MITVWKERADAGVTFPEGFVAAGVRCGLKTEGDDLMLLVNYTAKESCSCLFVMEMSEGYCRAWVKASPALAGWSFDRAVVPTLLGWTGSAVIHDIKGENWQLTAGWRARFSHCLLFNPTDPRSARYNPLLEVRRGTQEVRDVQNIADILVDPEGALERRNHWEKTGHSLLGK